MLLGSWIALVPAPARAASAAEVTASVTTSSGRVVPGVSTYVFTSSGAYTGRNAATDAAGVARVPADTLPSGDYRFRADYLGGSFWSDPISFADETVASVSIAVENVSVTVRQGGSVRAGVRVYLFGASGSYLGQSGTTDAQGAASFELPVGKVFMFRADLFGAQYWSAATTVEAGGTQEISIDTGGGRLTVTVDHGNGFLAGASCYLFTSVGSYLGASAKTDTQGRVAFDVPSGSYKVRCDVLGYSFWSDVARVERDDALFFPIPHRDLAFSVVGVLGPSSEPRTGVPCYLFTESGSYVGSSAVTDADGRATFRVPGRSFKVRADYLSFQYWSPPTTDEGRAIVIPEGTADVAVTWGEVPAPSVPVYVFNGASAYLGRSKTTSADGVASFRLPAKDLRFRADLLGGQYFQAATLAADQVTPVTVSAGGGPYTLIVDAGVGMPLEGVRCYLFSETGAYLGVTHATDAEGRAVFLLPNGTYRFRVDYLGHSFWSAPAAVPGSSSLALRIPQTDVRIRVLQGATPQTGVRVYLFDASNAYLGVSAVTDGQGCAVFTLPVGIDCRFRADVLGSQYFFGGTVLVDDSGPQDVTIDTGGGRLAVAVGDGQGAPISGKPVYLYSAAGSYLGQAVTTDAAGQASFQVPSGTYQVRCDDYGHRYWSEAVAVTGDAELTLSIPRRAATASVRFDRLGQRVPAEGVPVYLFTDAGAYLGEVRKTGADGLASFQLPEGSFKVCVDVLGARFWSEPSTAADFDVTVLEGKATVTVARGGQRQPGVPVYVFGASANYLGLSGITDAQGRVSFWLPDGHLRFRADMGGTQYFAEADVASGGETVVPISAAEPLATTRLAAGPFHVLAVRADGTLWTWGGNWEGQLGLGDTAPRSVPAPVGSGDDWAFAAAGGWHSAALKRDGSLWTWGWNVHGALGDGTSQDRHAPGRVGTDLWKAVAAGSMHTLAVGRDGSLWAWGGNSDGELGDGTTESRSRPVCVGADDDWAGVAAGYGFSVAWKTDGSLWAWGRNDDGQLGLGTTGPVISPTRIGTDADWARAVAGWNHVLALKADGSLWAWGSNYVGQLGDGTNERRLAPTRVGSDADWSDVAAGFAHGAGRKADGSLWTWGWNGDGALAVPSADSCNMPARASDDSDWDAAAAGWGYTIAQKADGSLWAAGTASAGVLGVGTGDVKPEPLEVGAGWVALGQVGGSHSLALKGDGSLWAWGSNWAGQLGNGLAGDQRAPTRVGPGWRGAAGEGSWSVAVKADGTLWAWGRNPFAGSLDAPVQVGSLAGWRAAAAGQDHALAVRDDGTLWAWGRNGFGQLGTGSTDDARAPVRVGADADWRDVAAGFYHSLAVKTDGSLWVWGANGSGQLGSGATENRTSPARVGTDVGWKCASGGSDHTVAVRDDGTLWAWGANGDGQLGDGTGEDALAPRQVGSDTDWDAADAGGYHTVARKRGGTVWAWGYNDEGELGDGTLQRRLSPVQIGAASDWEAVVAGESHTLALRADGTLWAWGYDGQGQLGGGGPAAFREFVPVALLNLEEGNGPPPIPRALYGQPGADPFSVTLRWSAPVDASTVTGYRVYRDGQLLATVEATSITDAPTDLGSAYSYAVTAVDAGGLESPPTSAWTRPEQVSPTVPADLAGQRGPGARQLVLTWAASDDNVGVTGYTVYRDGAAVGTTAQTTFTETVPQTDATYAYQVSAFDAAGNESSRSGALSLQIPFADTDADGLDDAWELANFGSLALDGSADPDHDGVPNSQEFEEGTDTVDREPPPLPPRSVRAAAGSKYGQIDLTWQFTIDNVMVAQYVIYRDGQRVGATEGLALTDTVLDVTRAYEYRVSAVDPKGNESAPSLPVTVSALADADGDGLDDRWEAANFGTLALGPDDDPDGDGVPNAQEFAQGTDTRDRVPPTVPEVLTAEPTWLEFSHVTLTWAPSTDNGAVVRYDVHLDGRRVAESTGTSADVGGAWWTCHWFQVSAVDAMGNESALSAPVGATGYPSTPSVWLVSPAEGQAVSTTSLTVIGGGADVGEQVVVNGERAVVHQGAFWAEVALQEGANVLSIVVRNRVGVTRTWTRAVTRGGSEAAVRLTAEPSSGTGPLAAQLTPQIGLSKPIARCEWDLDGDGAFEVESSACSPQQVSYEAPRLYWPKVRITDTEGVSYTSGAAVRVRLPPTTVGQLVAQGPAGLATDAAGNLYVAEEAAGRVSVFAPDGTLLRSIGASGAGSQDLSGPTGLAVDRDGVVYVADSGNGRVQAYDGEGIHLLSLGQGRLLSPRGVALHAGEVLVADAGANRIVRFGRDGSLRGTIGDEEGPGALVGPSGVTVSPAQEILVADSGHHRVARFSVAGAFLGAFGSQGTGDGQFQNPVALAWDDVNGGLAVADQGNGRVVYFDAVGVVKSLAVGSLLGFSAPRAVTTGADNLRQLVYVADAANRVVTLGLQEPSPAEVWTAMKGHVAAGRTEDALALFAEDSRPKFRELFCYAGAQLGGILAGAPPASPVRIRGQLATYTMEREEEIDGVRAVVPYFITFEKDDNDEWRIRDF